MLARALPLAALLLGGPVAAQSERVDLLTLAQGAVPLRWGSAPGDLRIGADRVLAVLDGAPRPTVLTGKPAAAGDAVEIVIALPAPTRFEGFAVPSVTETPSPSQTFFREVEVAGSAEGPDGPWLPLASGTLSTHAADGEVTPLALAPDAPEVRWVRLRLSEGIDVQRDATFLEFSELIGTGTQVDAPLATGFDGTFGGRGVKLELRQEGAAVSGCYDGTSTLSGTVQGNVLRATGADPAGIPSQFVLVDAGDGTLRGLRSSNGAPFRIYDAAPSDRDAACFAPEPPVLGCGSVLHGIGFDYDSDVIRAASRPVLAQLHDGLSRAGDVRIEIVGHSSSEGAADYNRDLSQRRAASVAAALGELGLDPARLSATGKGEDEPIAGNDDEAGRSLNRRVEVRCAG